ncbi:hypothetical protein MCAP1_001010 [Malassezia caprae]|uniref:Uncharacterized protein n=1 Tax=Malassezia caprae TaxID=1381934 RepID=A0AAF0E5D8_9BASI|nr:hypothetical protein MCAP1_001010 [Malassezia caprae]
MLRGTGAPPPSGGGSPTPGRAQMDANRASMAHAEFLLQQVRLNVDHLAATEALDPLLCRQLQALLATAQIRPPPPPPAAPATSAISKKDAAKQVKGKNKWTREVLKDTSVLPTVVETALTATTGAVLTDQQRSAIVEIVSLSQSKIADAVTDPERQAAAQRWIANSSKSAQQGLRGSFNTASENLDKWSKRQEQEAAAQRSQRQAQKDLEAELHRERQQFSAAGSAPSTSLTTTTQGLSQLSLLNDNPAAASVACLPSQHVQDSSPTGPATEMGAVTTTFSPWPGLVLTMSTVASNVTLNDAPDVTEGERSVPPPPSAPARPSIHNDMGPPPPRRSIPAAPETPPLPPPSHGAQAPLPPLPTASGAVPTALRPANPPPYR